MAGALTWLQTGFDVVLAATLLGFAAALVTTPDLFLAIVLFILFGLLMAVAWARLDAVDIAIAEAAIGAGLTGALFLNARGHLASLERSTSADDTRPGRRPPDGTRRHAVRVTAVAAATWVLAMVGWALLTVPREVPGLRPWALPALDGSGAQNPVTAVLLSFRAYDTWLEIAVILLAVVGAWSQGLVGGPAPDARRDPPGRVLLGSVRLLAPLAVLSGGYLLWRGTHAPGGAFQGGAVFAGAGVLLLLAEQRLPGWNPRWPLRLILATGVLVFVVAGFAGAGIEGVFLAYRGAAAERWIVVLEVAATATIAVGLVALFVGRRPDAEDAAP